MMIYWKNLKSSAQAFFMNLEVPLILLITLPQAFRNNSFLPSNIDAG